MLTDPRFRNPRVVLPAFEICIERIGECTNGMLANVVARVLVLAAWIAEPEN